jgi:hypothetical protein
VLLLALMPVKNVAKVERKSSRRVPANLQ